MSNKLLLRKDADLFKTVVSSYEGKQYRRGLKAADTILKKHPNHGETLAMKGIILNSMGKKEEAFDLVKLGLRNDVRSPICWHVFGLLHRSDGNYKEAAKCYLNALRIDADNQNILRDLSWLQVQTRDFNGFLSSRKRLLELKPSVRGSWIAYAVACHMKGENAKACEVISKYFDSLLDEVDPYEDSELLLFQNELIEAQGQYHDALQHLDSCSSKVVDKFIFRIRRARLLLFMGDFAGSFEIWKSLVMEQTENLDFHVGLQCSFLRLESSPTFLKQRQLPIHSLCLEDDQKTNLLQVYDTLSLSSRICIKIKLVLSFNLQNSKNSAFRRFLEDSLIHGIPSLAEDLCSLASVLSSIHSSLSSRELCLCWIDEIQEIMTQSTSPIVSFWGMYLKSQLYVFLGDIRSALRQLDFCINHTPTAIDAYTRKSELLESCGKFTEAAELANECRSFDLQDRYLNNFATLRFLRADAVSAALDTISIFTKHDGEPEKTLKDLQCSWYELELAESLAREKRWSHSIQKFLCVREHFIEESNDLFDFHSYCVRKSTLRAYIDAFGVAERLFQHPFYQRACRGALRILLHLNECPEDVDGLGHLSAADRKKERLKLKKKRVKSDNSEEEAPKTSEEFNIANCLSDALEWSRRVDGCLRACDGETLALIAELHMRRNKPIPAMRVLVVGYTIDRFNPDVCTSLTRFVMRMRSKKFVGMSDGVVAHIKLFLHQFFLLDTSPASLSTFLGAFATEAIRISSFTHVIAAAKAELTIDKKSVPETLTWLIGQGQLCNLKNYNSRIGQEFHKFLISIDYHQHEVVEKFQSMLLSPDM